MISILYYDHLRYHDKYTLHLLISGFLLSIILTLGPTIYGNNFFESLPIFMPFSIIFAAMYSALLHSWHPRWFARATTNAAIWEERKRAKEKALEAVSVREKQSDEENLLV